jgi:sortase A
MKGKISTTILAIIFLIGLSLLLYPKVSDYWNSFNQSQVIATYNKAVDNVDHEKLNQLWNDAKMYNEKLKNNNNRFDFTEEEEKAYEELLNVNGDEVMGYIEIPSIDVSLSIYHGVDDDILQIGAGHIEGTSLPVGGKGTHCVISGHRGLPSAKLFSDLNMLKEGDIFVLHVLDRKLTYEVDQIRIVLPDEIKDLALDPDQDYCTLVTCTPYGVNTHRLLVRGHRIKNLADDEVAGSEATKIDPVMVAMAIAIPILCGLSIWLLVSDHKKKKQKPEDKKKEHKLSYKDIKQKSSDKNIKHKLSNIKQKLKWKRKNRKHKQNGEEDDV